MINSLLAELEKRMKAYDNICETFGFFSELTSLSIEKIQDKAKNFVSSHPDDLEDTGGWADTVCCIYTHLETGDCERISRVYHVRTFVVVEFFWDISKRQDWVVLAHLSVHDGVQCLRQAELLKFGNSQRRAAYSPQWGM